MKERPGRSERQKEPRVSKMPVGGGGHDYGFAYKAAEKRHTRYGKAPDHVKDKCKRHGLVQPAKFGEFAFSGHIENASRAHQKKPLIKYMGKGMGDGPVYRHLCADADRRHHVADLAYDVIGQ